MDAKEARRFAKLAQESLLARYGGDGLAALSPKVREGLLCGIAAEYVLTQALDKYREAQEMIRACISPPLGE